MEEAKLRGTFDEEYEFEKAMYMYQAYPCLRNMIDSYVSLIKERVIGQNEAIEKLVYTTYYNQYLNYVESYTDSKGGKRESMMLIAPTGSGKSTMFRALEEAFELPVYRANVTAMTSAGYVGDKVENMLLGLIDKADGDVEKAEEGVLLIDEIDKKVISTTSERDVAGKSVQQELLKFFDNATITLMRTHESKGVGVVAEKIKFHTGRLTIIFAGACVGLDEIRQKRLKKQTMGFASEKMAKETSEYTSEDLVKYGFIPELVARINRIEELRKLTHEDIINIMFFSKESSMQEKVNILHSLGIDDIVIDPVLWEKIAETVSAGTLGVRELDNIISKLFSPIIFNAFRHTSIGSLKIDENGNYVLYYPCENKKYSGKGIEIWKYQINGKRFLNEMNPNC